MDVFSAQGRDPTSQWRLVGSVKRVYNKSLHGYVYVLEGGSSTSASRMQLPKNDRTMCECHNIECIVATLYILQYVHNFHDALCFVQWVWSSLV